MISLKCRKECISVWISIQTVMLFRAIGEHIGISVGWGRSWPEGSQSYLIDNKWLDEWWWFQCYNHWVLPVIDILFIIFRDEATLPSSAILAQSLMVDPKGPYTVIKIPRTSWSNEIHLNSESHLPVPHCKSEPTQIVQRSAPIPRVSQKSRPIVIVETNVDNVCVNSPNKVESAGRNAVGKEPTDSIRCSTSKISCKASKECIEKESVI